MNIDSKIHNLEIKTCEIGTNGAPAKVEKGVEMPKSAMRLALNALTKKEQVKSYTDTNNAMMPGGEAARAFNSVPKGTVLSLVNLFSSQKIEEGVQSSASISNKQNSIKESKKEEINSSKEVELKEVDFVEMTEITKVPVASSEQKIKNCFEGVFSSEIKVEGENAKIGKMTIGGFNKESGTSFKAFTKMSNATNLELNSIGKGANKETYLANFKVAGRVSTVAISTVNIKGEGKGIKDGVDLDETDKAVRKQEINMANMVFSKRVDGKPLKNVIPGGTLIKESTGDAFIATKFCNKGTIVNTWLKTNSEEKKNLLLNIAEGQKSLHEVGIVHRDLHGGNILIHANKKGELTAYLSDFGCSTVINGDKNNIMQNRGLFSPAKQSKIYHLENEFKEIKAKIKDPESKDVEQLKARQEEIRSEIRKIGGDPAEDSFAFGIEICRLVQSSFKPEAASEHYTWLNLKDDPLQAHAEVINFVNKSFGDKEGPLKDLVMNLISLNPGERLSGQTLIDELNAISDDEIAKIWPNKEIEIEDEDEDDIESNNLEEGMDMSYGTDSINEEDDSHRDDDEW